MTFGQVFYGRFHAGFPGRWAPINEVLLGLVGVCSNGGSYYAWGKRWWNSSCVITFFPGAVSAFTKGRMDNW